jgi:hypothetical protein
VAESIVEDLAVGAGKAVAVQGFAAGVLQLLHSQRLVLLLHLL